MFDCIGQRESAAPATSKYVHRSLDAEMFAEQIDVIDQVIGGIANQRLFRQLGIIAAGLGRTSSATSLVKQNNAVAARIKESCLLYARSAAWPAVQKHHRGALRGSVFMPIDRVVRAR